MNCTRALLASSVLPLMACAGTPDCPIPGAVSVDHLIQPGETDVFVALWKD